MGHTVDTYHDIQSIGMDKLRNVYASSGLCIAKKTQTNEVEALKEIIRAWDPIKRSHQPTSTRNIGTSHDEQRYKWEHKVLSFKQWVLKQPLNKNPDDTLSQKSAVGAVATVRGFFSHWHVPFAVNSLYLLEQRDL